MFSVRVQVWPSIRLSIKGEYKLDYIVYLVNTIYQ